MLTASLGNPFLQHGWLLVVVGVPNVRRNLILLYGYRTVSSVLGAGVAREGRSLTSFKDLWYRCQSLSNTGELCMGIIRESKTVQRKIFIGIREIGKEKIPHLETNNVNLIIGEVHFLAQNTRTLPTESV